MAKLIDTEDGDGPVRMDPTDKPWGDELI